jgi:hypothetical protein
VATPTWLYGSESWVRRKKEENGIQAAEMRFLRAIEGRIKKME